LPYKDWTGKTGQSSKDEFDIPILGREEDEKKGDEDFEDDFSFLAD
jgi:hypothetical protein